VATPIKNEAATNTTGTVTPHLGHSQTNGNTKEESELALWGALQKLVLPTRCTNRSCT
jgi:hypothetical protein